MKSTLVRWFLLICSALAVPAASYAQEAVLSGTVTDATGAVLPGTSIRATHEASGNTFDAVTDARGAYRIPVRIGTYKIVSELAGFTSVTRTGVDVLVGQTAVVNIQMSPSAVAETVTVTGEAPLIDVAGSALSGN